MRNNIKNSSYNPANIKSLVFNPESCYSEIILTEGIVILNRAKVSNCEINDLQLNMPYTEEGLVMTKKRLFHRFFHKNNTTLILWTL